MIQRKQTLYLLAAAILAAIILFYNPHLWRATLNNNRFDYFPDPKGSYLFFILFGVMIALAVIGIFLFKKRPLQFKLTVINLLVSIGVIILQYFEIKGKAVQWQESNMLIGSTYLPAAFIPIIIVVLLFLAARGIYKDERLVKSLNRLR